MTRRARRDSEDGVFLVLYGAFLVGLITMVAMAIDLNALRTDRGLDRNVTDSAATAGADQISPSAPGPFKACEMAWNVAAQNLGYSAPGVGNTPCSSPSSAITSTTSCASTDAARSVTSTIGPYTVTVTTPVPDADPLMTATAPGGGKSQPLSVSDSTQCSRIGVTVSRARTSFFGGAIHSTSNTTTVHSVAIGKLTTKPGSYAPALVALNPTNCETVAAAPGTIHVFANGTQPGIIEADSTGSACSSDEIVYSKGSGVMLADSGSDGTSGVIGYWGTSVPSGSAAYGGGGSFTPTPTLMTQQITRVPLDTVYRCSRVTPLPASCSTDFVGQVLTDYAAGGSGISHLTAYTGSCSPSAITTIAVPANGLYVNCATFSPGAAVTFGAGLVVFSGTISASSGASMLVNTTSTAGLPVATATADSLFVVQGSSAGNAVTFTSGATLSMANTVLVTTTGGLSFQGGSTNVLWSADSGTTTSFGTSPYAISNGLTNLVFWTEATGGVTFQGGPAFVSDGIFALPNSPLNIQGKGTLDARNVQFWCDSTTTNNASAIVYLRPDPSRSITTLGTVSALIR